MKRISAYADIAGIPVKLAIDHAVSQWMDDIGDRTLDYISNQRRTERTKQRGNVIAIA